jgi:hypothetical protein
MGREIDRVPKHIDNGTKIDQLQFWAVYGPYICAPLIHFRNFGPPIIDYHF